MTSNAPLRVLVIDDNAEIHADFRRILGGQEPASPGLDDAKAAFFGRSAPKPAAPAWEIDAASQGREALELVQKALAAGRPYALAFVDVRMPPGWDGVETIARLWEADPDLQCVICTAFADYSWEEMIAKLGRSDRLLILKKPFDPIEAWQITTAMTEKWSGTRRERARVAEVERAGKEASAYAASLATMNRALEASRARAEAALAVRSQMLAGMSQEIRDPLLSILEHADALRTAHLTEPARSDHALRIRREADEVLTRLSQLFDLAAVEANRLTLTRCPVAPLDVVDEVVRSLADRAREKSLALVVACATPIPSTIQTDPARLRQILQHLVGCAIASTSAGGVRVELALDTTNLEEPLLSVSVIDTGAGLSHAEQARLFEPFGAAGPVSAREPGGAGLVLARRLAQLLGGDLGFESAPGAGSTFRFTVRTGDLSSTPLVDLPRAPIPSSGVQEGTAAEPSPSRTLR